MQLSLLREEWQLITVAVIWESWSPFTPLRNHAPFTLSDQQKHMQSNQEKNHQVSEWQLLQVTNNFLRLNFISSFIICVSQICHND